MNIKHAKTIPAVLCLCVLATSTSGIVVAGESPSVQLTVQQIYSERRDIAEVELRIRNTGTTRVRGCVGSTPSWNIVAVPDSGFEVIVSRNQLAVDLQPEESLRWTQSLDWSQFEELGQPVEFAIHLYRRKCKGRVVAEFTSNPLTIRDPNEITRGEPSR